MIKYSIFFWPLLMLSLCSPAQEALPSTLKNDLDRYSAQRLQEKLYLHTDKEFYLAGELCWFKLYAVDAASHHPLALSKVAYLEWLDRNNKPVLQTKIGLDKGHGHGSIFLPLTIRSGNYKLRAYTSWMKNDGEEWFFEKNITVVNCQGSAESPITQASLTYELRFFPEGGDLIEDLNSKIAFRVSDQYGRGIGCTGVVTEDDQDTILRFQPLRFGIGNFSLTPRAGHHYRATIRLADGTAIARLLPTAGKQGTVMTVTEGSNDSIMIGVQSTDPTAMLTLIAHTRRSVKFAGSSVLKEGKSAFYIDRNRLGDGISHLTVFNAGKPVCERLLFKNPKGQLHVALSTDKSSYATRQKISLQIGTSGSDRQPLPADCSISVFRVDSLQTAPARGIGEYLYLSSDLHGSIESPGYYLQHPDDKTAIDNLMLSHGWRRFRWDEVVHRTSPAFRYPPEYNGSIITGTVVDTRTGAPAADIHAYLSVPGTRSQFASAVSGQEGQVTFEMKDLYGSQEIIVQTNTQEDSLYRVEIENPFLEKYTGTPLPPFSLSRDWSSLLTDNSVAAQVVNNYYGARLKQLHFPAVDTSLFYYKADNTYLLDDYTRFTTMEEVLREYVVLMLVQKRHGHFHLPVYDMSNAVSFEEDPLILLDGVPVFDIDRLMAMDPLKIRRLDMVHRKFFYGNSRFDGIMNWTTYKGDLGGYTLDPRATVVDYEGLELEREFYSPSYEEGQAPEGHLPDFRNVLYWSPAAPVQGQANGSLSFYSSDIPGKYVVVVEGLAPDGSAGSSMTTFEVR